MSPRGLYGVDLRDLLSARSLDEQRRFFETMLAPLFDKPAVRWATANRLSLYGLGIPPAQYEALAGGGDMARGAASPRRAAGLRLQPRRQLLRLAGVRPRLRRDAAGPLPPYLRREHFDAVRARVDRVEVLNRSITEYLAGCPDASRDRYVLLDAQDWMTDAQLNALWAEITRTARPGARVIFRTAAEPSLLPGRLDRGAARALALRGGACRARSPSAIARRSMAASISTSSRADVGDAAGAALMDRLYRRQRHFYDVTRKYYLLGRDRLIDGLAPPAGGRVLEIGCGTARNLVTAARAWPEAQFFGIDISAEMLDTARRVVGRAGLAARIELARGDATSFDPAWLFGVPCFSRIFFSYSLSMIPEWRAALAQALIWLPAGGELHIVDFGGQERLPSWFRAGLRQWLARFHVSPRDELAAELAALAGHAGRLNCLERPHGGYAQYAVFHRGLAG